MDRSVCRAVHARWSSMHETGRGSTRFQARFCRGQRKLKARLQLIPARLPPPPPPLLLSLSPAYVTPGPHDFHWNRASCPDNDRDRFTWRPQSSFEGITVITVIESGFDLALRANDSVPRRTDQLDKSHFILTSSMLKFF